MTDDRTKRRARTGIPVPIDPELTPPPQEPPQPGDFDTLPLQDQVTALHGSIARHNAAIGSLWQIRHLADRADRLEAAVVRIENKVDAYTQSFARVEALLGEFVMPGLKSTMASTDGMARQQQHDSARLGQLIDAVQGLVKSQQDLGERLRTVEVKVDKISDNTQAHAVRLDGVETVTKALDVRVTALERAKADQALVVDTKRRIFTKAHAAIVAAAGVAGFFAKYVVSLFTSK